MTKGEIEKMFCEAASTRDFVRRRQLLDALVKEDPENRDVQGAQAMLGACIFREGEARPGTLRGRRRCFPTRPDTAIPRRFCRSH